MMIETANSVIATDFRSSFLKLLESFSHDEQRSVVVSHFGTFSQDLINSLSTGVEELMVSSGDQKIIIKRVFSILIEGLQNIRLHGEKDEFDRQLAFLFVTRTPQDYRLVFGNIIQEQDEEMLENYLQKINAMDSDEQKKLYLEILTKGYVSKKGGAGLGFLTMRMKSHNELQYTLTPVGEGKLLFTVAVNLSRS